MAPRITAITDGQRAQLAPYAEAWIERVLATGPADRSRVEDGMRRCYEAAGLRWHGRVVWVESPLVACLAGPLTATLLDGRPVRVAVDAAVRGAVDVAVDAAVSAAVSVAVDAAVRGAVGGAVGAAVSAAVDGAVDAAVDGAVGAAVRGAVGAAVGGAVDAAVRGAVRGAVDGPVRAAVDAAVSAAVDGAVDAAVDGAVGAAVRGAVGAAVGGAVDAAVRGAVRGAVDGPVRAAVDAAVRGAVRGAVDVGWQRYLSPWWPWDAWRAACVEILGIPEVQHLVDALRDANGAGWWWPHTDYVIVSDRPTSISRERIGPDGWGSHQLHDATGPSIAWGDEWQLWHWHGTQVPSWVIEAPTLGRIGAETNTEIRRCAIESYGWGRYLADVGAVPVSVEPDPGNPGQVLALHDLPEQIYAEPVRLLVMSNGSLDRDGSRRQFAETVPATCATAVEAAAWQYDVSPEMYRQLARRT